MRVDVVRAREGLVRLGGRLRKLGREGLQMQAPGQEEQGGGAEQREVNAGGVGGPERPPGDRTRMHVDGDRNRRSHQEEQDEQARKRLEERQ